MSRPTASRPASLSSRPAVHKLSWSSIALSALVVAACGSEPPVESQADYVSENEINVSYNGDLTLLGSYNELSDKSPGNVCVKHEDDVKRAKISEPNRKYDIEYVSSKEDLASKLGVDLSVQGRYGIASGNIAANLVSEYSNASNTRNFLVKAHAD